jgi:hypothetical protein
MSKRLFGQEAAARLFEVLHADNRGQSRDVEKLANQCRGGTDDESTAHAPKAARFGCYDAEPRCRHKAQFGEVYCDNPVPQIDHLAQDRAQLGGAHEVDLAANREHDLSLEEADGDSKATEDDLTDARCRWPCEARGSGYHLKSHAS